MTTEEKLENFYNHSIESAKNEAERIVTEYQAALDQQFAEHQKRKKEQTEEELAAEKENLKRENNKALSAEQLQIKRSLSAKSLEIEKKIFAEVEEKLKAFQKTPEYVEYLRVKIQKDLEFAKGGQILFYLDASDEGIREQVEQAAGVKIQISREKIIGGLLAAIEEKNILIDDSFRSMLAEERESFRLEGGHVHE